MTSNELKHHAKVQEWGSAIQGCRSSGLSVREWCRQRGVTPTTYYRWESKVLSGIRRKDGEGRSVTVFVELPAPQPLRNVSERTATLNVGSGSIDLYQEVGPELLRALVELLRIC
ncbi:MAG: transposase [Oscillospiraceae bacterium]